MIESSPEIFIARIESDVTTLARDEVGNSHLISARNSQIATMLLADYIYHPFYSREVSGEKIAVQYGADYNESNPKVMSINNDVPNPSLRHRGPEWPLKPLATTLCRTSDRL